MYRKHIVLDVNLANEHYIVTDHVCKDMLTIMSSPKKLNDRLHCEQSPSPSHGTNTFHQKLSITPHSQATEGPDWRASPYRRHQPHPKMQAQLSHHEEHQRLPPLPKIQQVSCRLWLVMQGESPTCISTLLGHYLPIAQWLPRAQSKKAKRKCNDHKNRQDSHARESPQSQRIRHGHGIASTGWHSRQWRSRSSHRRQSAP